MKVIYVEPIIDRITAARRDAMLDRREIEKIVLTGPEAERLKRELDFLDCGFKESTALLNAGFGRLPFNTRICGILVESEVK